jgi:hypothetical protein
MIKMYIQEEKHMQTIKETETKGTVVEHKTNMEEEKQ